VIKKVLLAITLLSIIPITSACAADNGYRYWGYFQAAPKATTWTMAQTGPSVNVPDGSVEGWAFTFSSDVLTNAAPPKALPNFAQVCGTKKAMSGMKRIAVVIDFGASYLSPKGEAPKKSVSTCAMVPTNAVGSEILAKVAKLRAAKGLICGINSYPAKECGAPIDTPKQLQKM
jgi:hypothetical protein